MGIATRREGALDVDDALRSILAELRTLDARRRRTGVAGRAPTPPLELDADLVADVEQAMKTHLPVEALAVLATHVGYLEHDWGMTLARIAEHTDRACDAGCPRGLVALARHWDGRVFVCVRRRHESHGEAQVLIVDTVERSQAPQPLWLWLREQVDALLDELALSEGEIADVVSAGKRASQDCSAFVPMLVHRAAERIEHLRRVRHKIFGEGTVLRELDTGDHRKLEVDFPGVGRKMLLERFVERA